jgi:Zn-dependent protease
MPDLSWLNKFLRLGTIRGVPILAHWTVPAISIFLLGMGIDRELTAASAMIAYLSLLTIHELGHQLAAQWRGYRVSRIEIYPFHGVCRLDHPEAPMDAAFIAGGGPIAQFIVAVPFVAYRSLFGYTHLPPIDAFIAILGFVSPAIALFNLLPIAPLDGRTAWTAIPLLWRHGIRRLRRKRTRTALDQFEEAVRNARKR